MAEGHDRAQDPHGEPRRVAADLRPGAEGDELAVDLTGQGTAQLEWVPFTASEQA
jgi:hypothetical protein